MGASLKAILYVHDLIQKLIMWQAATIESHFRSPKRALNEPLNASKLVLFTLSE